MSEMLAREVYKKINNEIEGKIIGKSFETK